jgi:hypothetical protein
MSRQNLKIAAIVVAVSIPILGIIGIVGAAYRMARAPSANCVNNIKLICLAARLQAVTVHTDRLPDNIFALTNDLLGPQYLHCPADRDRAPALTWSAFLVSNCSYIIASGPVYDGSTNEFVRCAFHGHVGLANGTVVQAVRALQQ